MFPPCLPRSAVTMPTPIGSVTPLAADGRAQAMTRAPTRDHSGHRAANRGGASIRNVMTSRSARRGRAVTTGSAAQHDRVIGAHNLVVDGPVPIHHLGTSHPATAGTSASAVPDSKGGSERIGPVERPSASMSSTGRCPRGIPSADGARPNRGGRLRVTSMGCPPGGWRRCARHRDACPFRCGSIPPRRVRRRDPGRFASR